MKTRWLQCAQWRISEASDPVQAAEVLNQLTTTLESKLSSLEMHYKETLLDDLAVHFFLSGVSSEDQIIIIIIMIVIIT